ncbi:MAG: ABC transporter transmembrane domain-containing protein, partial [Pseudomonadota bacterium]
MRSLGSSTAGDKKKENFEWGALKSLAPYLWPHGQASMKARVVVALVFLALAKFANVYVPFLYKEMVDLFSDPSKALIELPIALLLSYGVLRILTIAFAELRDAVFAKVGQRAIRDVALSTFRHLHKLSLRFHLDRQTGGLSRSIERGTKGIDFLLTFMLFNILPTLLEISLVCGVLWYMFNIYFALVTFSTIVGYISYTMFVTEWRLKYRRRMNETDQQANTRAIDSLLNYETVKYFGNEDFEAARFDRSLRRYEEAAITSKTTLAFLNIGQAFEHMYPTEFLNTLDLSMPPHELKLKIGCP